MEKVQIDPHRNSKANLNVGKDKQEELILTIANLEQNFDKVRSFESGTPRG